MTAYAQTDNATHTKQRLGALNHLDIVFAVKRNTYKSQIYAIHGAGGNT